MFRTITSNLSREKFYQHFLQTVVCDSPSEHFKRNYLGVFMGKANDDTFYMFYKPEKVKKIYTTILKGKVYGNNEKCMIEYHFTRAYLVRQPLAIIAFALWILGAIALYHHILLGIIPFVLSIACIVPIVFKANKRKKMLVEQLKKIAMVV